MDNYLLLNRKDSVAVALRDGLSVPAGHKIAVRDIAKGEDIIKYGFPVGRADEDIPKGAHVHTHNVSTNLGEILDYRHEPDIKPQKAVSSPFFEGYPRKDGSVGIRNEIWILNTVGCVNMTCKRLAELANERLMSRYKGKVDGVFTFNQPYGCSQMGDENHRLQLALAGLVKHPNAAGVLVVGLGCENNNVEAFKKALGGFDPERVKFLVTQEAGDELEEGLELIGQLLEYASGFGRRPMPVSMLKIGLKCGGSDGFSGITANPCVGAFTDMLTARGGCAVLTEVPEMFGAETLLMNRCESGELFGKTVALINDFKRYFIDNGQVIYENPSAGNKEGGITTLEEKSLGCTQKGGLSPVTDVIAYGFQAEKPGLTLLEAPGNDLVATTALTVAGCHAILFTTGRGTPHGAPVPTLKISTNTKLAQKKRAWIDFDAGRLIGGASMDELAGELFNLVLETCSGEYAKNELFGYREVGIFNKGGVTL